MTHAWLIIAHNEFGILQMLLNALDSPDCAFYVHIDKKVKVLPELKVTQGKLRILKDRLDVRWGTVSQLKAELKLLECALQEGGKAYYHIISGTHLPLKPFPEISDFFNTHAGEEVMRFWPQDDDSADFKIRRYHFPIRYFKDSNRFRRDLCQFVWKCVLKFQKKLGIRHLKKEHFYKTDQWLSLTDEAAGYLVSRKREILKKYRWSFCGDEYFIASELKGVGNRFRILDYQHYLYVEFQEESPRTLSLLDYRQLCKTDYLFARKFSDQITE